MKTLKTLKDIDWSFEIEGDLECVRDELKQEAMKWLKYYRVHATSGVKPLEVLAGHKINFIIEFFNIEKEDLE